PHRVRALGGRAGGRRRPIQTAARHPCHHPAREGSRGGGGASRAADADSMNISAPFIARPIATALLMVGLLLGGLTAYPLLPVAALPSVNYPTLQIKTQPPGAYAATMASSDAHPHHAT